MSVKTRALQVLSFSLGVGAAPYAKSQWIKTVPQQTAGNEERFSSWILFDVHRTQRHRM